MNYINESVPRAARIHLGEKYKLDTSHTTKNPIKEMPKAGRVFRIVETLPEGMQNTSTSPEQVKEAVAKIKRMHGALGVRALGHRPFAAAIGAMDDDEVEVVKHSSVAEDEMRLVRRHMELASVGELAAIFELYSQFSARFEAGWKIEDSIASGRTILGERVCLFDERILIDRSEYTGELDQILTRDTRRVKIDDRNVESLPLSDEIEARALMIRMMNTFGQSAFAAEIWFKGVEFGFPAIGLYDEQNPIGFRLISNMAEVVPESIEILSGRAVELGLKLASRVAALKKLAFGPVDKKVAGRETQISMLRDAILELKEEWPDATVLKRIIGLVMKRNVFGHLFSSTQIEPGEVERAIAREIENQSTLGQLDRKRGTTEFNRFLESLEQEDERD